jgi:glycosyltransferase involved in cell wall biosynthesis
LFSVTLIISTYNWKEALALTLRSVTRQSALPNEVIVADDGSGEDTARLIRVLSPRYPVPLLHVWQEDRGFRLGRIRNLAIAQTRHPYVIFVDGDLVLHPDFVADHLAAAAEHRFVRGSRVFLPADLTGALLRGRDRLPRVWAPGLRKRWSAVRLPWLARVLLEWRPRGVTGHDLACWRRDAVAINGFDERFKGWGREDDEFAQRLLNAGIRKRRLHFAGIAFHLHHAERARDNLHQNDALLAETVRSGRTWAEAGLDQHVGRTESRKVGRTEE